MSVPKLSNAKEASRDSRSRTALPLILLVVIGSSVLIIETISLLGSPLGLGRTIGLKWRNRFHSSLSADEIVPDDDLLHLNLLHEACTADANVSLTWLYGSPGNQAKGGFATNLHDLILETDKDLLRKLRQCPSVDIFLPNDMHTSAYCEDAVAYVKYPVLFLDHHWGVFGRVCHDRVTKWFKQEGNPRNARVFYTKHTSLHPGVFVRKRLGEHVVAEKDFSNIKFFHIAGTSTAKGTRDVLDCWSSIPNLPPLEVYIARNTFYELFQASYKLTSRYSQSPVNVHLETLDRMNFSKLIADASFVLNPSCGEGYGHTNNQARAAGAIIITSDIPPMNEMVLANETGVLISVRREKHPMVVLGGKYSGLHGLKNAKGLVGFFQGSDVCEAVHRLIRVTSPGDRAEMSLIARRNYHADTKYFAKSMQNVLHYAEENARGSD
ncbi:hypothetical protein CCR75_004837 [Bremia lactucae]|uniref:Glycosyl transferase family 1 domain-containing protein n=1 Tax=Bremia lactucae TaxID=4779 RepID=A0A976ICT8_BRELC|nr:hypothetical protein CCR75_004837 [Bremia lactucae]